MQTRQQNLFSNSKYGNVGGYYCRARRAVLENRCCESCNYHPSQLELSAAQLLDKMLPPEIWSTHEPIQIMPGSSKYPAIEWRCDFQVNPCEKYPNVPRILIELKGLALPEFLVYLKVMALHNPKDYERLIIVGKKPKKIDSNFKAINLAELRVELWELQKYGIPKPTS